MADDRQDEPEDLDTPPSFFPYDEPMEVQGGFHGSTEPVRVKVENVFEAQNSETSQYFVLLSDGRRKLPIVIGQFEAAAITVSLDGQQPDRPLTHDLLKNILVRLGSDVVRVIIDDLWGSTYYAKVFLKQGGSEVMVDSRPSDAIALALRTNSPIFVAEGILEEHGS